MKWSVYIQMHIILCEIGKILSMQSIVSRSSILSMEYCRWCTTIPTCNACFKKKGKKYYTIICFKRWFEGRQAEKDEKTRTKFMHAGRRVRATCILEEDTNPCLPAIEKLGVPKQVHRLASTPRMEKWAKNTLKTSHRILQDELLTRPGALSLSLSRTPG